MIEASANIVLRGARVLRESRVCVNEGRQIRWLRKEPASSFYRLKQGRLHARGDSEVVVFSPNRGGAVGGRCRRYRPLCPSWQSTEGSAGGVLLWSRSVPHSRVVPTLTEDPAEEEGTGSWQHSGENSVRYVCTGCRRFPQSRKSAGDGGIVTGVGGRDSGHSCCAAWRPDAI